jgi:hypothetical protein
MEKQGVIREGLTPPETAPEKTAGVIDSKTPTAAELDRDFRKRAAEVVRASEK